MLPYRPGALYMSSVILSAGLLSGLVNKQMKNYQHNVSWLMSHRSDIQGAAYHVPVADCDWLRRRIGQRPV